MVDIWCKANFSKCAAHIVGNYFLSLVFPIPSFLLFHLSCFLQSFAGLTLCFLFHHSTSSFWHLGMLWSPPLTGNCIHLHQLVHFPIIWVKTHYIVHKMLSQGNFCKILKFLIGHGCVHSILNHTQLLCSFLKDKDLKLEIKMTCNDCTKFMI